MSKLPPKNTVGIVCFRNEDVLLIKRANEPRKGEWSIPGGRVEPGESYEAAALRELMEETRVEATLIKKVAEIDADFGTHHYILHDYLAIWQHGEPVPADDALEAKFVSPKELAALTIWETTRDIIESARTAKRTQSPDDATG